MTPFPTSQSKTFSQSPPGDSRTAVSTQIPSPASFPSDVLLNVYARLGPHPGVAGTWCGRDARAFAAAHPRLDRLYRFAVITCLEARDDPEPEGVQRMLRRHPRVRVLTLSLTTLSGLASYASPQLRVFEVKYFGTELSLDCVPVQLKVRQGVETLLSSCHGLAEFSVRSPFLLRAGRDVVRDEILTAIVAAAPPALRVLSLGGIASCLTDTSGMQLGMLHELRELDLRFCTNVGSATFDAVATLPSLTKLTLAGTSISDAHTTRALPQMLSLRHLDVSECRAIGTGLWNALPPALTVLWARESMIFEGVAGSSIGGCRTLRELRAGGIGCGINDWAQLANFEFGDLRKLQLWWCGFLGDDGLGDALYAMPHLEALNMHDCSPLSDEAVVAIAQHPTLRYVDLRRTAVGRDGTRTLRLWQSGRRTGYRKVIF